MCMISVAGYWLEPGETAHAKEAHMDGDPEGFFNLPPKTSAAIYLASNIVAPVFFPELNSRLDLSRLFSEASDKQKSVRFLYEQVEQLAPHIPPLSFAPGTLTLHSSTTAHISGTMPKTDKRVKRIFAAATWEHERTGDISLDNARAWHRQRRMSLRAANAGAV
jgi:hypothetical protein